MKDNSISKLVRINKVSPPKMFNINNFTQNYKKLRRCFRFYIAYEAILGLNRLHIVTKNKLITIFSNIYSTALLCIALYFIFQLEENQNAILKIIKYTNCIEFVLLVFSTIFIESKLSYFFQHLYEVDQKLNIPYDRQIMVQMLRAVVWILFSGILSVVEFILGLYVSDSWDYFLMILYVAMTAHDAEQIFFCTLLRSVYWRLQIVKLHVRKVFKSESYIHVINKNNKISNLEHLANKTELDVNSLHRVYEILHLCTEDINRVMSFPMLVTLTSSGLSTTFLAMRLIKMFQTNILTHLDLAYALFRCTKYTILVILPCYYSNVTKEQVQIIRSILHDAINLGDLERIERRKVKTLLQLVQDNEFDYTLWGVIKLNMSLPLSYISICTTYLVIIIQFSKFID